MMTCNNLAVEICDVCSLTLGDLKNHWNISVEYLHLYEHVVFWVPW